MKDGDGVGAGCSGFEDETGGGGADVEEGIIRDVSLDMVTGIMATIPLENVSESLQTTNSFDSLT